jgi:hypothetical protein
VGNLTLTHPSSQCFLCILPLPERCPRVRVHHALWALFVPQVATQAVIATVTTRHEGRGVSTVFTPLASKAYALLVRQPAGISRPVPLPAALAHGATMVVDGEAVFAAGAPVQLRVFSTAPVVGPQAGGSQGTTGPASRTLRVSLSKREREVLSTFARTGGGGAEYNASAGAVVAFEVPELAGLEGVLSITVADATTNVNMAERWVLHDSGNILSLFGL